MHIPRAINIKSKFRQYFQFPHRSFSRASSRVLDRLLRVVFSGVSDEPTEDWAVRSSQTSNKSHHTAQKPKIRPQFDYSQQLQDFGYKVNAGYRVFDNRVLGEHRTKQEENGGRTETAALQFVSLHFCTHDRPINRCKVRWARQTLKKGP
jgi:hypothetical protein